MNRRKPTLKIQSQILVQQKNRCAYCNAEFGSFRVVNNQLEAVVIHWDHVIPFSYSLRNDWFVAACQRCNLKKSNRHILPWKAWCAINRQRLRYASNYDERIKTRVRWLTRKALKSMKQIESTFRYAGFDFELIKRVGSLAVFKKKKPSHSRSSFEVVRLNRHKDHQWPDGKVSPAHEAMPPSEQWGRRGWTFMTEWEAERKLGTLTKT